MRQWNTWGTMTWFLWLVFFLGYELFAGIEHKKDIPMLTQALVRYVPWPFTLGTIVWLFVHFATRYFSPAYIQWLKSGGAGG